MFSWALDRERLRVVHSYEDKFVNNTGNNNCVKTRIFIILFSVAILHHESEIKSWRNMYNAV